MGADRFQTVRLSNGLRVAAAPLRTTTFAHLLIGVRVGSRYEHRASSGISHFVEHMLYRGSQRFPSSFVLNHSLESLGDGLLGGTSREYSLFSISVLKNSVRETLSILADMFHHPLFDSVELETEKKIVLEELLEEVDESGDESDLEEISRKKLFGSHGLGNPVIGTQETLQSLTREDVLKYFQDHYQPDNMVVVGVGNLDPETFFNDVNQLFGDLKETLSDEPIFLEDWESDHAKDRFSPNDPPAPAQGPLVEYRPLPGRAQVEAQLSFLVDGERSSNWLEQAALERLLDDGLASRLQRGLCERRGLLYEITASNDLYSDVGVFDIGFSISPENLRVALREVFHELKRLKSERVPAEELTRLRGRMQREAVALFENPRQLGVRILETLLLGLDVPLSLAEWSRRIGDLDPFVLAQTAQRLFVPARMVAVIAGQVPRVDRGDIEQILEF